MVADWYDRNGPGDNDHYTQPGLLFTKAMNDYDRHNLVANIVGAMSGISGPKKSSSSIASYATFSVPMCDWDQLLPKAWV